MDYSSLIEDHISSHADVSIGGIPVSLTDGSQFGIMEVHEEQRVIDFKEKPAHPDPMPGDPERCLASMGIYVFNAHFLFEQLCRDATQVESSHDFGRNIIPAIINSHDVRAYAF